MERLLISNVRLVDPSQGMDMQTSLLIEQGMVAQIGDIPDLVDAQILDADGLVACPGLIDMHVHLRDPGLTHKEDIISGCEAAAAGGFTAVACMPNTSPVCDTPEVVSYIISRAREAAARVYPMAAITRGLKSGERTDMAALKRAGAVALTDDGRPVTNNRLLLEALCEAEQEQMLIACHAEDPDITNGGIMHEGTVSRSLGVRGVHRASEDVSTAEAITLAAASGTRVHIQHVSTEGAVALIRDAKARGVRVTCETGPHYFTLTHEKLLARNANFRMAPPLREERDRQAILAGIADGTVDCIATDHAPHAPGEKADFEQAPNGVVGLETALGLCLSELVHSKVITLSRLVEMMSQTPARLLGVTGGSLRVGSPADITIFDPARCWQVDAGRMRSRAQNTCFDGMTLTGQVCYTICGGRFTYTDERMA